MFYKKRAFRYLKIKATIGLLIVLFLNISMIPI